jgi:RND family efflux transporter MFP subunit
MSRIDKKVVLPIAVIGVALLGALILGLTSTPVSGRQGERILRAVRVVPVELRTTRLEVRSQGTVAPRTESELIPEVSGRVVWTSPALVSGGYFESGEPLLRIDRLDYIAAVERARAALARARGEDEHARETLSRQKNLRSSGVVSDAALDDAERSARVSAASVREARVVLEQAKRDLERSEIVAPFSGRVREERVDVGQFLNRGQSFATVYATDYVEVTLPIADAQLAYIDMPFWERRPIPEDRQPEVTLTASFAGQERAWTGRVVRTSGEIDAKSRLVHAVARVANDETADSIPLPVGLFVQARIAGRTVEDVAVVPREALQAPGRVLVVDEQDRLRFRDVEVLRLERDQALISSGLVAGERVCISAIQAPVDGMAVRPVEPVPASTGPEGPGESRS